MEAWEGKNGEVPCEGARKGSFVTVIGSLKHETWTDKDGNKRDTVKITARQIYLVQIPERQSRQGGGGQQERSGQGQQRPSDTGRRQAPATAPADDGFGGSDEPPW